MGHIEETAHKYYRGGSMSKEIIEYRRGNMYPDDIYFLLCKCIPKDDVSRCTQSLGIIFPGVRAKSISHEDMAHALSEEYFSNYAVAEGITALLDDRLSNSEIAIPKTKEEIKLFKKHLKSTPPEQVFSYVWKLSGDRSDSAYACLNIIHKFLGKKFDKMDKEAKEDMINDLMALPPKVEALEGELKDCYQKMNKQEKYIKDLEQNNKENLYKLEKSKDTKHIDSQSIKNLEKEIAHARQRLAEYEASPDRSAQLAEAHKQIEYLHRELKTAQDKLSLWKNLKRAGLFIDVQNLIICARQEYNGSLNFESLWNKVSIKGHNAAARMITEGYAYLAEDPAQEKTGLKNNLRKAGLTVRTRPIMYRADGTAKGDWDLGMTIEVLERIDRLDIVVLGTGDGDFLDLVQYIKKTKPQIDVELVCFQSPHYTSERLIKEVSHVHYLGMHDIM